jgi:DnaJ-class molecular chaperone
MEIGLEESLFGFTRSFQHLDGSLITVERTETTTKDIKHIVKGKGLINKQGYPGNLIIKFKITIPKFSDQQLDMWEDFFNQYD